MEVEGVIEGKEGKGSVVDLTTGKSLISQIDKFLSVPSFPLSIPGFEEQLPCTYTMSDYTTNSVDRLM